MTSGSPTGWSFQGVLGVPGSRWTMMDLNERGETMSEAVRRGADGSELEGLARVGDFVLLERLGKGGMGVVYRARQESLGREVAVKLVRPELLLFEEARERFRREVETVARMSHPSIASVFTVGEERGVPYFAMELVRGASLEEVLGVLEGRDPASLSGADFARALDVASGLGKVAREDRAARTSDPDALFTGSFEETCLRIAQRVAEALEHAHRRGVVHRDVKPSNVMVTSEGRVLLVDFGLSTEDTPSELTRTGTIAGSLPFLAPELLGGARPEQRTDVYALGVTLYRTLSLRLPFEPATPLVLQAAIQAAPPPALRRLNGRVSWEAETVCLVAMEREAARRYPTAAELAADLERALDGRALAARRPGPVLRLRRWVRRHPARALAATILLTVPSFVAWREHRASVALEARYLESREVVDRMLTRFARGEVRTASGYRAGHAVLEEAISFYERFARERPADLDALLKLAAARRQQMESHSTMGQAAQAREALATASELLDRVESRAAGGARTAVEALNLRAELAKDLAYLELREYDSAAADAAARVGLELAARLGPDHGNHARLMGLLLAARAQASSDDETALQWLTPGIEHLDRFLASAPGNVGVHGQVLALASLQGQILNRLGRAGEARDRMRAALERARGWLERFEDDPRIRAGTAQVLEMLAGAQALLEEVEPARESYAAAIELYASVLEDHPDVAFLPVQAVRCQEGLALLLHGRGDVRGAVDAFAEILRILGDGPLLPHAVPFAARARRNLANLRAELSTPDALATCDGSLAWLEAHAEALDDAGVAVHDVRSARAEVLISLGRWKEGAAEIRTVLDGPTRPDGEVADRIWAASRLGDALEAAREIGDETVAARPIREQALDALFEATALGFADAAKLETDPDFAYLRGDPDFDRLVEDLRGR